MPPNWEIPLEHGQRYPTAPASFSSEETQTIPLPIHAGIHSVLTVVQGQTPVVTAVERRCLGEELNKQGENQGSCFLAELVAFSKLSPRSRTLECCGCAVTSARACRPDPGGRGDVVLPASAAVARLCPSGDLLALQGVTVTTHRCLRVCCARNSFQGLAQAKGTRSSPV